MKRFPILLILFVITAILAGRLLPHAPNFSPLASLLLFGGAYYSKKRWILWSFLALFISDVIIGFYAWPVMVSVYVSFLLTALVGFYLRRRVSIYSVALASLGTALLFFLVTNGAVWYFGDWYSHDWSGLMLCYTLAVPFFKNTLLSNVLYSGLLFGAYEALLYWQKAKMPKLNLIK